MGVPKNHTKCLRALSERYLNSNRLCHNRFFREPGLSSHHHLGKEPFPHVQPEPHLIEPQTILSGPVTVTREKRSVLTPCKEAVGCHEVTPKSSPCSEQTK